MNHYCVSWKDRDGVDHSQIFESTSASGAIAMAIEKITLLHDYPNLITRVRLEETNG